MSLALNELINIPALCLFSLDDPKNLERCTFEIACARVLRVRVQIHVRMLWKIKPF